MEPRVTLPEGGFATRAVHGAVAHPLIEQRPLAPAIHPAATWSTERSQDLAELLADRADGYVYGRYDNPTATTVHATLAALHHGEWAWSAASGMAAILATLEVLRGDGRILATRSLYGGTRALLARQERTAGWGVDLADLSDAAAAEEALASEHSVVYAETIANPTTDVAPLGHLADLCADAGAALVVDNTFASPYLCRPLELGARAVVESATKYLGGHADVVAGVVVGDDALIRSVRHVTYELGMAASPFAAFLLGRGLQTLHLRLHASSRNAQAVAETLEAHGAVVAVRYPGLASHPHHDRAQALFGGRGCGGMLAFDLGGRRRAEAFADACQVFARAASLGAAHSLVVHPASTTHRQLSDADLDAAGIGPGVVRLSVGIEDGNDLVADVRRALAVAAAEVNDGVTATAPQE